MFGFSIDDNSVWSIVRPDRPKHLDERTTTFETFERTDYVVGT